VTPNAETREVKGVARKRREGKSNEPDINEPHKMHLNIFLFNTYKSNQYFFLRLF